jgi:hypothetical protein
VRNRSQLAGNVALLLLGLAVAASFVLLSLSLGTAARARFEVGRFSEAGCPDGADSDIRCYGSVVTNVGTAPARVRCRLQDRGGPPARFLNGSTAYVSAPEIDPKSSITLLIQLQPTTLASPALPELLCGPA